MHSKYKKISKLIGESVKILQRKYNFNEIMLELYFIKNMIDKIYQSRLAIKDIKINAAKLKIVKKINNSKKMIDLKRIFR